MNFVDFLLFLIVSNAEPLPLNLDNSDLLSTSSPLLNLPLPDSPFPESQFPESPFPESPFPESPLPESPLPESPLPGSLSLNLPASGNDPSSFNPFLNDINTDNNPTSGNSAELAPETSDNGAGDGRESSVVLPSIIYAESRTNTDDLDGICHPDSNSGQNRRKSASTFCVNRAGLAAPPILSIQSPAGSTEKEKRTEDLGKKDVKWLSDLFTKLYGRRKQRSPDELAQGLFDASNNPESSCVNQPVPEGTYPRPYTFCCLGPAQFITLPVQELRLARRQDMVTITNWFNCQVGVPARPWCTFYLNRFWRSHRVCCKGNEQKTDPIEYATDLDWWQWGFKGVDCVDQPLSAG